MIAMTQNEYNSIANESLEELREETPEAKIELRHRNIHTRWNKINYEDLETQSVENHQGTVRNLETGIDSDEQTYWIKRGLNENEIEAAVAADTVSEYSPLDTPNTWYDESKDALIVEDMGEHTLLNNIEDNVQPNKNSIFLTPATKALLGDSDFEKNIAYLDEENEYQAFDMDNAGSPISHTFKLGAEYVEKLADKAGYSLKQEEAKIAFAEFISEVAKSTDIESLEEQLEGNMHKETIVNNFKKSAEYHKEEAEVPESYFSELNPTIDEGNNAAILG